jgi:hypothetical protein
MDTAIAPSRYPRPMLVLVPAAWAAEPATISPPVTPGAFRAAFPVGTTIRYRIASEGVIEEEWRWVATDAEGCTIHTWTTLPDGTVRDDGERRSAWAELLGHAVFPAERTTVEDATIETPGGTFATRLYTITELDGSVKRLHFARDLPGPPVSMTVERGGAEVSRMTLLERSVRREGLPGGDDPAADALAARVVARAGDPSAEPGLTFTFVTGAVRRTHRWDVPGNRVEVTWTDGDQRCTAVAPVGYAGDDPLQKDAWAAFVNDQFWLLAPAKVLDAGAIRTADGADLWLFFEGVGLTPGDRYVLRTDADGDVTGWTYTLRSGRSATWAWDEPTRVGGLSLSLRRTSPERTITFEDVASGPVALGPDGGRCVSGTPP